jgi:uncharacterized membrane protein
MAKIVTQNRFKSPVLWTTLASAILAFLVGIGVIDLGLSETIKQIILAVLTCLAGFGIINNPENPKAV